MPLGTIMFKQKSIIHNKIADVSYADNEMKCFIIILREYSKQVQTNYKTRNLWMGKLMHQDICEIYSFEHYK